MKLDLIPIIDYINAISFQEDFEKNLMARITKIAQHFTKKYSKPLQNGRFNIDDGFGRIFFLNTEDGVFNVDIWLEDFNYANSHCEVFQAMKSSLQGCFNQFKISWATDDYDVVRSEIDDILQKTLKDAKAKVRQDSEENKKSRKKALSDNRKFKKLLKSIDQKDSEFLSNYVAELKGLQHSNKEDDQCKMPS